jgi:hypothetical protein
MAQGDAFPCLRVPPWNDKTIHTKWEGHAEKPGAYRADLVIPAIFWPE